MTHSKHYENTPQNSLHASESKTDFVSPQNRKSRKSAFKPPKKITDGYLYNAGLGYLNRFTCSREHFKTVMLRKIDLSINHHKSPERDECVLMLERTIQKFEELGLINDELYCKGLLNSLQQKGLPIKFITMKLQQKGIPSHLIDTLKESLFTNGFNDIDAAVKFCKRKRIGPFSQVQNQDRQNKDIGKLARGGFSYDIVQKIMAMTEIEALNILDTNSF